MKTVFLLLAGYVLQFVSGALVNVALNKPAEMSSRYVHPPNSQRIYVAGSAVNGDTAADGMDVDKIIHTARGKAWAWWKVDLQREVQDAQVKIYFRTTYKGRRNGVKLYTSKNPFYSYPDGQLCDTITGKYDGSNIKDVYSVKCSGSWSYLLIYTDTNNDGYGAILDFGEVEVMECSESTYGDDCTQTCSQRNCVNTTSECSRDGKCPDGCQPGWTGTDCTQECGSGNYGSNCKLSCANRKCTDASSSCDRVTGQCIGGCQAGYGGLDCVKENVALGKPAQMSSVFNSAQGVVYSASTAVDGNTVTDNEAPDKLIHTAEREPTAWWMVDLQRDVQDAEVTIYFRTNYKVRRNGIKFLTTLNANGSFEDTDVCHTITGRQDGTDIPDVYTTTCPGTWRHLIVHTDVSNDGNGAVLDFGEVEVFQCADSTYGKECELSCSERNCAKASSACERDGRCENDRCKSGWMGLDCTQECPDGLYGPTCSLFCSHRKCAKASSCNPKTGKCVGGCQTLYDGKDCTESALRPIEKTLSKLLRDFQNFAKSGTSK